jgi:GPH family glycoside/pentoside/hexuronide:cation symporter
MRHTLPDSDATTHNQHGPSAAEIEAIRQRPDMQPLSWGTRLSYAGGDVACNIVFGMVSSLLVLFYTDYIGIDPVLVGIVFLITRLFDGASDMVMGVIVDRTHSKYGKSRPWIMRMAFPFALSAVLLFTVPHTSMALQALYVFVAYNFVNTICYTAINLPYGSLSSMMTRSEKERSKLSICRMGLSPLGKIMSVTFSMPLVKFLGNTQQAWIEAMCLWAVIAFVLLVNCFARCKENVKIPKRDAFEKQKRNLPVKTELKALVHNRYFWACMVLWMMQSVSFSVSGTILPYYCKYIFGDDTWMYSQLFTVETLVLCGAVFLSTPIVKRFGKRNSALAGAIVAIVGQLIFCAGPKTSYALIMFSCVIRSIGLGPLNAVVFSMLGDAVEYGEWKTHIRQEGFIFSAGSVGTKVGAGLTRAIMTLCLSVAGYVSSTVGGAAQPDSVLHMIVHIYEVGPLIVAGTIIVVLVFYRLDKMYPQIIADLAKRESHGEM